MLRFLRRLFGKGNFQDEEFPQSYFQQLAGLYQTSISKDINPAAKAEAESILAKLADDPHALNWDQVFRLESAILKLEPLDRLRRRVWSIREEYREMASPSEWKSYLDSHPPDPDTAAEPALRADLESLMDELHWLYTVIWVQEEFRSRISQRVITLATIILLIIVFIGEFCFLLGTPVLGRVLWIVAVSGILGGLTSTVRRIQTVSFGGNTDLNLLELERGQFSVYLSPFLGAVFAIILYFLFIGGLLKGALFPDIPECVGFFPGDGSMSCLIYGKLIIWSFIAGFAEQFVPDSLDQLARKSKESGESNSGKTA